MPVVGNGQWTGTPQQANNAVNVTELLWDNKPFGPTTAVVFAIGENLTPGQFVSIQLFPGGEFASGFVGSNGAISVVTTYTANDNTYKLYNGLSYPNGWWGSQLRAVLSYSEEASPNASVRFTVQLGGPGIADLVLDPGLSPPTNFQNTPPIFDPEDETSEFTLSWTNQEELPVVVTTTYPGGFVYEEGMAVYPNEQLPINFVNEVPPVANWTYSIRHFNPATSEVSAPTSIIITVQTSGPVPDIDHTMSGQIDLGDAATVVFIGDPSGIYTLMVGKTHDTIIDRITGQSPDNELDLAIPRPFVRTGPF